MTEENERSYLEERYMFFHNLDPNYLDDQDQIREMREMDYEALEADVKAAEECYEYMSGSCFRKNFGVTLREGK